jgi:hypothetical protein
VCALVFIYGTLLPNRAGIFPPFFSRTFQTQIFRILSMKYARGHKNLQRIEMTSFPSLGVYLFSGLGKMSVLVFKGCTRFLQELRYSVVRFQLRNMREMLSLKQSYVASNYHKA